MNQILKAVSDYYKLPISKIIAPGRKGVIVKSRHVFFYLCRLYYPENSFQSYSDFLMKKGAISYDHATVIHAVKKISGYLEVGQMSKEISDIKAMLNLESKHDDIVVKDVNLLSLCDNYVIIPAKRQFL